MTATHTEPISVENLESLRSSRQPLFGLDPGTKTIGVSISDSSWNIASPLVLIRRKKFKDDAQQLLSLIEEHKPSAIVIGLPINMDGTEGPRAQSVRAFARNLAQITELPIAFWDERLSTIAVTRTLLEADVTRKRRKDLVDKMAAAYILQGALDFLTNKQP